MATVRLHQAALRKVGQDVAGGERSPARRQDFKEHGEPDEPLFCRRTHLSEKAPLRDEHVDPRDAERDASADHGIGTPFYVLSVDRVVRLVENKRVLAEWAFGKRLLD